MVAQDIVHKGFAVDGQAQGLADIEVGRGALFAVHLQIIGGAIGILKHLIAALLGQQAGGSGQVDDVQLPGFKHGVCGVVVLYDPGHQFVDGNVVLVKILVVFDHGDVVLMLPFGDLIGAVAHDLVGVGAIGLAILFHNVLPLGHEHPEGRQVGEIGHRIFQRYLKGQLIHHLQAQIFLLGLALEIGLGVFDAIRHLRVIAGVLRVQKLGPGIVKIMGCDRDSVPPFGVVPELKGIDQPVLGHGIALGHPGYRHIVLIQFQKSGIQMANQLKAGYVGNFYAVHLRRLGAQIVDDGILLP